LLKPPTPGQLVKYKLNGYDNLPYIDEGIGFIEAVVYDEQKGYRVRVHIFNKVRHRRKNFVQIQIGSIEEEYSIADFYNFFKILEH
jgi:hypothetical protein